MYSRTCPTVAFVYLSEVWGAGIREVGEACPVFSDYIDNWCRCIVLAVVLSSMIRTQGTGKPKKQTAGSRLHGRSCVKKLSIESTITKPAKLHRRRCLIVTIATKIKRKHKKNSDFSKK